MYIDYLSKKALHRQQQRAQRQPQLLRQLRQQQLQRRLAIHACRILAKMEDVVILLDQIHISVLVLLFTAASTARYSRTLAIGTGMKEIK